VLPCNLTAEAGGAFSALDYEVYCPAKQEANGVGLSIGHLIAGGTVEGKLHHVRRARP
jgi:hypothetical protein